MTKIVFLCLLLTFILNGVDGQIKLSQQSKISVLTCAQGDELYSAFGHSALRVYDAENNMDLVFNYGTFDFNTPNFYLKFANGKLDYILSVSQFKRFLAAYFKENRSVKEQVLNLSLEDKQSVFDALMENYRPENRYYKYDFFFDNCATRIVDIIGDHIDGEIVFENNSAQEVSFRTYLHHYLSYSPWIETGLNLLLGLPADKIATRKESTFLPDFLLQAFDHAVIKSDSATSALVIEKRELLSLNTPSSLHKTFYTPMFICSVILLVVLVLSFVLNSNILVYLDRFLFFITGLVGILVAYLWFVTDHSVPANNLNILWALPTFVYLAFSKFNSKFSKILIYIHLVCLCVFLLGWKFIPQAFPMATIPMALLLVFRLYLKRNRNTKFV
ncbi:lipoprotein N-acyltransferase Lnb domain-containing protein [Saccharicrinis fermentans]|uniref:Uncharacterized protein n=1 Tax=Saccharicrinis fermentans DSM 9555 = JCM 21142 TaxID=869213 RepID=W7YD42_9BACT|nr:DUF4105 domain-containing protein [Saccharicrinis fermentans]GAF02386.1 hypothetical protein JCM21142_31020 [Saccharicrinis fermentans DSM 9555 = JCM 21142]